LNIVLLKSWIIWAPAALFALFMVFLQTSMSVMIDPLKESFKLDSFGIGLLSASFYYTYALLQVPIGTLVDRFGVRKILIISILGTCVSCIGFSLSYTLLYATLCRVLMGMSCASAITCAFFIGAVWFPKGYFPLIVGLSETMGVLGGAFSTKLLAPTVKNYGWRMTFQLCFIFAIILLVASIALVKDRRKNLVHNEHAARKINIFRNLLVVLKSKDAWICGTYAGFLFAPLSLVGYLWGVQFIMIGYNFTLNNAASAIALIFIGAAIGNPIVALITEKFSIRKQMMLICAGIELVLCSILIYLPILPNYILYLLIFLIGFASTSYIIPFSIVRERIPSYACATAMAFVNVLCGCIGAMLFQPLTGWILSLTAGYSEITGIYTPTGYSFMIALTILPICFIGAIALVFMIDTKKTKVI
jgi:MFS family permease